MMDDTDRLVPPKLNITQVEIDAWIREIQAIEKRLKDAVENDKDIEKYNEWIHGQSIKVAPGFDYGVMQPHRAEPLVPEIENDSLVETNEKQQHQHKDVDDDVNELDRIFGKTTI
ncbi:uncharacterized protein J8A68_002164 [[Candida] subhashii]|uniref:Uncharacterized protein n=1 Tax=[Candida] subhashii TaxID=561895 RepID=A0A8J5UPV8_9ASCO|nr:uncharacterized protein J8A68_002164 [[Candida] subhashii]KAG7664306.1 hypothetical protein J8A68_002164 [[Candida] subhashii]